jgi:hypothetical protein
MAMADHLLRQSFLGSDSSERLAAARVAIVGLCGGGSHVAQQLAHVGVGHFYLFDSDRSDESNRNRMIGLAKHRVGDPKTEILRDLIHQINPDADVAAVPREWQEDHVALRDCTAIFGCVDSFTVRDQLERYARRYLVPYIDVGMDIVADDGSHTICGQVILSMPGHYCMWCMGYLTDALLAEEARHYGAAGAKPQVVWPNGVLASTAVGKFMSLLTPWRHDLKMVLFTVYDGNQGTLFESPRLQALAKSGWTCPHFSGPESLGDASW